MKGATKKCSVCSKEFYVYPSRLGNNFCSRKCANAQKANKKEIACKECGRKFLRSPSQMKPIGMNFCSPRCVYESRKKEMAGYEKVTPKSEVGRSGKRMKGGLWSTKKSDLEFSRFIRNRDKWTCFFCKKTYPPNSQGMQNSHFWGRGSSATRYDPENCDAACAGCHFRNEGNKQGLYRDLKIAQLGEEGYRGLERRARSTMKRSDAILALMSWLQ